MKKQYFPRVLIFFLLLVTNCLANNSTSAEERRKQVTDSFRLFREESATGIVETKKGIHIRFSDENIPQYTWQDIPILLELAQSDEIMTQNIPSLIISSYAQHKCREGMIALWLVEGLRCRQAEPTVEITVGKKHKTKPYQLPLNPMCTQQGMKLAQSENSTEIHQKVLQAYQSWWQQVKDLPPEKAAQVYPLSGTNIRWYGGGVPYPADNNENKIRALLKQKSETLSLQVPDPGPENQGLRLRLAIETTQKNRQDHHSVRMGIVNVSFQPITLVASPIYDRQNKNFAAYLKAEMAFTTFPEIIPPSAQTAGSIPTSPPPEITVPPQGEFKIQWQSQGGLLKDTDYYNTTPYFPGPGLYSVRARIIVKTKSGREILLYSNEQSVSIGGSTAMPKHATAKVTHIDPEKNTVIISLGAHHKIQAGDEFYCAGPFPNYWKLKITEVRPWNSEAVITVHNVSEFLDSMQTKKIDPLPPKHAVAQLWCFPSGR